jgi:hypothetical protein
VRYCSSFIVAILLVLFASPSRADDVVRNAWGFYAAPTTYTVTSAGAYNNVPTNTSLDFGIYYTRFISRRFSVRGEVRLDDRRCEITYPRDLPVSTVVLNGFDRINETMLEVPLLLMSETRCPVGERELRISVGGGLYYAVLLSQYHYYPVYSGRDIIETTASAGDSQRMGFILDGGVTMETDPRHGVFLHLRLQEDADVFGVNGDTFAERYAAFGFMAGFEWTF